MASSNAERQAAYRARAGAALRLADDTLQAALMLGAQTGRDLAEDGQRFPDWMELFNAAIARLELALERATNEDDSLPETVATYERLLRFCRRRAEVWQDYYGDRARRRGAP